MALTTDLHLVICRCFWWIFAASFLTIFTVVLTYVTSTAAMTSSATVDGVATYSSLMALRPRRGTPVSPPPPTVCDCGHVSQGLGSFADVVAVLAAESNININNRHQLIVLIHRQRRFHPTKEALRIVQPVSCVHRAFQSL